jgi:nicotinamidase-related amidase
MPGPSTLEKKKTVVVAMDYQLDTLGAFPPEFQSGLIARANKVLTTARKAGLPIIFVLKGAGTTAPEIDPRLSRQAQEAVLIKKKHAPFASTDIDARLKKLGIDTIVLMGIHTGGDILSTVRCGTEIDYKFFVISDCCADRDQDVAQYLFEKVFYHTSTVMDSKAFFELLAKS